MNSSIVIDANIRILFGRKQARELGVQRERHRSQNGQLDRCRRLLLVHLRHRGRGQHRFQPHQSVSVRVRRNVRRKDNSQSAVEVCAERKGN